MAKCRNILHSLHKMHGYGQQLKRKNMQMIFKKVARVVKEPVCKAIFFFSTSGKFKSRPSQSKN